MLTTGSKFLLGSAAFALVGAFFLALATAGHEIGMATLTGAATLGYKGPVGDHFGYAMLVGYAAVAILIGVILSVTRDGDPERGAAIQGLEAPAPVMPVRGANFWPLIGAVGSAMIIVGLVESGVLFIFGLIVVGLAALQWTIHAWSDRATADPVANQKAKQLFTHPLDLPLVAIVAIFLFVFLISRILLAFDEGMDVIVFGGVPALAFAVAIILSFKAKIPKNLIVLLAVVGSLIVLGLGIGGLAAGQFQPEKDEHIQHPYRIPGPAEGAHVIRPGIGEGTK